MSYQPCVGYFAGTNGRATRVHETSLLYMWATRFNYVVEVTKQIGHIAILTAIAKGPFGKVKWLLLLEIALVTHLLS
jgi:hypothetical protein